MRSSKRRLIFLITAVLLAIGVVTGVATAGSNEDGVFAKVRTVYDVVAAYHKDGADLNKFAEGAIKGGLAALGDPYTNYFSPQDFAGFMTSLNGEYTGIGAYLDQDGQYVVISAPMKDSPAAKAGLQSGDRLLEVNGVSLVGKSTDIASQSIRGKEGTTVTLKVERPSEKRTFTVTITRQKITVSDVNSKMLDNQIGYIQITTFGQNTPRDFYQAVADLKAQGAKGLVLDLRQNPGGYVDAAVDIASAWVPAGQPVLWEVGKDKKEPYNSTGKLINLPTSVLVDNGSASASEILSGALQDYGIAPLVGVKTFGKGTMQGLYDLKDGSAMKVTIAEYLTAKGRHVHGIGLTPDYVVANPVLDPVRTAPMQFHQVLTPATAGLDVLYLQYRLQDLGYDPDISGFFGVKTNSAVLDFAKANNLPYRAIVDEDFLKVLNTQVDEHNAKAVQVDLQLEKAEELVHDKLK